MPHNKEPLNANAELQRLLSNRIARLQTEVAELKEDKEKLKGERDDAFHELEEVRKVIEEFADGPLGECVDLAKRVREAHVGLKGFADLWEQAEATIKLLNEKIEALQATGSK